ncbi:hypothetical protein HOY80DRAFT_107504 [Tuber brumale]|nr:hypothetical protein HOY80DRAFT_107504 [Tuber brumale]
MLFSANLARRTIRLSAIHIGNDGKPLILLGIITVHPTGSTSKGPLYPLLGIFFLNRPSARPPTGLLVFLLPSIGLLVCLSICPYISSFAIAYPFICSKAFTGALCHSASVEGRKSYLPERYRSGSCMGAGTAIGMAVGDAREKGAYGHGRSAGDRSVRQPERYAVGIFVFPLFILLALERTEKCGTCVEGYRDMWLSVEGPEVIFVTYLYSYLFRISQVIGRVREQESEIPRFWL